MQKHNQGDVAMKRKMRRQRGQAIVEYIIIIVIVAVAALTVMGIFSDRIREIIAGAASTFGADDAADAVSTSSVSILQNMEAEGLEINNE
jgi:Flp pilus assembly pilin Flp